MKKYYLLLVLAGVLARYAAIANDFNTDIQFLSVEQKFSQNTVSTILKDHKGFLWLGTRNGLNRYDGINIWQYHNIKEDSTSLPSNYIRVLFEDSDGILWIGSLGGGLVSYDRESNTFVRYEDESSISLKGETVISIHEDKNKNLWLGTETSGLFSFNRSTNLLVQYRKNVDDPFSISGNNITGILNDGGDNLWITTWGGGLSLFNINTKRFIHYKHDPENPKSLISNVVRSSFLSANGELWLGTNRGLNKVVYDRSGKYIFEKVDIGYNGEEDPFILSIIEDSSGRLWIGTENDGVCVLDIENGQSNWYGYDLTKEYSLGNNSIWSIYEDNSGIVWIGTFNKGLFKVDEKHRKFEKIQHHSYNEKSLSNSSVSSFAEDKRGNVWVGTDGGGLNYWDRSKNTFSHFNKSNQPGMADEVLSLMIDSKERLWVGCWQGGVMVKDVNSNKLKRISIKHDFDLVQDKENVFSIIESKDGKIWFAVFRGGLVSYDPKSGKFQSYGYDERNHDGINTDKVRLVYEDSKGNIWVGTEGTGINLVVPGRKGSTFKKYLFNPGKENSLSNNMILSFHETADGKLWVGTSGGLNEFDPVTEEFKNYGFDHGFPDEVIYAIEEDAAGLLWLSTDKGIIRFDRDTQSIRIFDLSNGLQSLEFFKQSSFKSQTGELLFGGVDGFNLIHPKDIVDNNDEPQVYLVDFKISNESVMPGEESVLKSNIMDAEVIELRYYENDFSFEFSQLNYAQSKSNLYAYQLVKYDSKWQEAGSRREAYYTNVPPGTYTFKVRGTNEKGDWSPLEASVKIVVLRAWYNTFWAYIIYTTVIVIILIWSFQTIVNRERLQSELKVEHLELSKMQELDEMKSSFFANISHEFRSPLTLILGPLKGLKENIEEQLTQEQVGIMLRNAENLLNLINQLLELSKLESGKMRLELETTDVVKFLKTSAHSFSSMANRRNIAYKVVMPKSVVALSFDKDKMEKIVINLLSNAFKYTNDFGKVELSLEDQEKKVILRVKDDGIGIPEDEKDFIFNRYYRVRDNKNKKSKGTGIGLSLTKELVELHHGHIDFKSIEDDGTVFEVHLYKGDAHLNQEDFVEGHDNTVIENKGAYEQDEDVMRTAVNENIADSPEKKDAPLILIIEDNDDIRDYIRSILNIDYQIIVANNGTSGCEMAKERIPDLIISDIMMPGIDGYEVCKRVKGDLKTSHIPIVLLTAKASNESALEGFEKGADYYITKPFNPKLLALRVRNVLDIKNKIKDQVLNNSTLDIQPKNIKIAAKDESFIEKAVSVIEENISNSEFFVDDLGRELGLSRMQLYRKLKGLIGQSANEFIRSIRLKRAAQLIRQDQMTISEITYHVGFNDLQYFRDCFKKQFGVNPSEYAQDVKEKEG
ncbi:MAG: response regulator [Reichenbachiella sp.]